MEPFFKVLLAESWGCPDMLRIPSGFKALRLFAHGLQTLSRLLNARALSGSNPQPPPLDNKKGPQMGPFFKVKLAESWGFEPQMPFWGILA